MLTDAAAVHDCHTKRPIIFTVLYILRRYDMIICSTVYRLFVNFDMEHILQHTAGGAFIRRAKLS